MIMQCVCVCVCSLYSLEYPVNTVVSEHGNHCILWHVNMGSE